jgi:hypothetical protein
VEWAVPLNELLNQPAAKALRDGVATVKALQYVGASVVVGLGGLYLLIARDVIPLGVAITAGVSLLVIGVMLVGFWYHEKYLSDRPFYEILEMEALLIVRTVGGHHRYEYTKEQTIRSLRKNLRLIDFKAHWTGEGAQPPKVSPLNPDHVVLDGREREADARVHRWIYPGEPVGRNMTLTTGLRQEHEDDVHRQRPYFREGGGRYKLGKLKVTLRFSLADEPEPAPIGGMWDSTRPVGDNNFLGNIDHVRTPNKAANTVDFTVEVKNPQQGRSYGLYWKWEPSNEANANQ